MGRSLRRPGRSKARVSVGKVGGGNPERQAAWKIRKAACNWPSISWETPVLSSEVGGFCFVNQDNGDRATSIKRLRFIG